jgi:hypothetical protein
MMYCVKIMKQMFESMLGIKAQVDEIIPKFENYRFERLPYGP